jgi:predicted transposase/invertase (TIGR01784 family)
MPLEEAADTACQYCIEHDILRNFLLKNRNEVKKVLLTEYNAKHQRKLDRRDAKAEGRIEGILEGKREGMLVGKEEESTRIILNMHRKGFTVEQIASAIDKDIDEVKAVIEKDDAVVSSVQ